MAKKGRGGPPWKMILIEVRVAVLAVLGKQIVEKTADWLSERKQRKNQESKEEPESSESEKSEKESPDPSKTDGENGTS